MAGETGLLFYIHTRTRERRAPFVSQIKEARMGQQTEEGGEYETTHDSAKVKRPSRS